MRFRQYGKTLNFKYKILDENQSKNKEQVTHEWQKLPLSSSISTLEVKGSLHTIPIPTSRDRKY